jgi:predicted nucleic acid-binding protein
MTERLQVNISLSTEDSETLDALVAEVKRRTGIDLMSISRSAVAAIALQHGMDMMTRDFASDT